MSESWYYASNGQQCGPITSEAFAGLVGAGTIHEDTLVWREGLEQWQPLRLVPDAPRGAPPPLAAPDLPSTMGRCASCQNAFLNEDLVPLSGRLVCSACKPLFLEKIREGVSLPNSGHRRALPVDPVALVAEVRARGYTVDVGSVINRAWDLYKASFWPSVGVSAIAMVIIQACSMVPFLGPILGLLIQGPLMAGMYLYYIHKVRGEQADVGQVFSGFTSEWWRYMLTFLVTSVPMFALMLLVALPVGVGVAYAASQGGGNPMPAWLPWAGVPLVLLLIFAGIYIQVGVMFALPLAADLKLGPIQSTLTSFRTIQLKLWKIVLLLIVCGLLLVLGAIALLIGIFFALPMYWYSLAILFEEIYAPRPGQPITATTAPVS